jgi:alpha-ketoglutarate-dependent taurine dioxygenase
MAPTITPIDASFGAVITDVKLASMSDAEWKVVEDAFHEYGALVFPAQHLSAEEQVAFGERFGTIEVLRAGQKHVQISNQADDGRILSKEEKRFQTLRGNEGWHTDSSYMPLAAKASILSAQVVPSRGGETALADMRDAYDKLDDAMKEKIADLVAYHSLYASQAKAGFLFKTGEGYGFHTHGMPIRPLVKVHPVTGRKSLFIGRHAFRIPGMDDKDAQALLDELLDFAVQSPRTYTHQWQPGDVMVWDNRCILHRACPYDYSEPRVMRHVRVAGEPETELVETTADERADSFEPTAVQ